MMPNLSCEEVRAAIIECRGMVFMAAKTLGCTSAEIVEYMRKYPEILAAVDEQSGERIDLAEMQLDRAVINGEPWAIQFLLKQKRKITQADDTAESMSFVDSGMPTYRDEILTKIATNCRLQEAYQKIYDKSECQGSEAIKALTSIEVLHEKLSALRREIRRLDRPTDMLAGLLR
jgi:hypothetical protein